MTASPVASRSAAPTATPTRIDPVALHAEASNACSMAKFYTLRGNTAGAARKATQALAALRRLAALQKGGAE